MDARTLERFWSKVDKGGPVPAHRPELGPCWVWTASTRAHGYGQIYFRGNVELAHRVAWFLELGRWPEPCGLHRCDNPSCVRFAHLFEGTQTTNLRDMTAKGRRVRPDSLGERNGRAVLTEADVREIRDARARGERLVDVAARFGVGKSLVSLISRGECWQSVA